MPTTIVGGHGGLNKQLFSIIENRPDIEVKYETKAVKLLVDETARVCGVKVKDVNGFHDIPARAVILASGRVSGQS